MACLDLTLSDYCQTDESFHWSPEPPVDQEFAPKGTTSSSVSCGWMAVTASSILAATWCRCRCRCRCSTSVMRARSAWDIGSAANCLSTWRPA